MIQKELEGVTYVVSMALEPNLSSLGDSYTLLKSVVTVEKQIRLGCHQRVDVAMNSPTPKVTEGDRKVARELVLNWYARWDYDGDFSPDCVNDIDSRISYALAQEREKILDELSIKGQFEHEIESAYKRQKERDALIAENNYCSRCHGDSYREPCTCKYGREIATAILKG